MKRAVRISGIGETQTAVRHAASIVLTPAASETPAYETTALILKSLTSYTPDQTHIKGPWKHITGLKLADDQLMSNDPIDIIIGADLFGMLLLDGVRKGPDDEPVAQNTTLGWILSSPISSSSPNSPGNLHIHLGTVLENLDSNLRCFWETEEIPQSTQLSPEDQQCEEHFLATHFRNEEGRYVVRHPFKSFPPQLGESRFAALSSLYRLERRFEQNPFLASEYRAFLSEYEQLDHMLKIPSTEPRVEPRNLYYIPHHAVLRADSATTRLRVVFNASCKTTNGTSLNDHLLVGSKLQTDLTEIILQWRQYR
ncbi:uncharacterized protein [Temnothorax longispinosus]|uniref:uncharacterized protein n=1 Tax=Temnothorax longispinosus TaxID=300112 RepID=UPI003A98F204